MKLILAFSITRQIHRENCAKAEQGQLKRRRTIGTGEIIALAFSIRSISHGERFPLRNQASISWFHGRKMPREEKIQPTITRVTRSYVLVEQLVLPTITEPDDAHTQRYNKMIVWNCATIRSQPPTRVLSDLEEEEKKKKKGNNSYAIIIPEYAPRPIRTSSDRLVAAFPVSSSRSRFLDTKALT